MEEVTVEEEQLHQGTVIEAPVADVEPALPMLDGPAIGTQEDQPPGPPAASTAELEAALAGLRTTLAERETELQAVQHQLASATARYREALLAAAPEVPEDMVTGATPEEVEASLSRARQVVERIRSHIESQMAEQRVPTGAPIRSAPDLSGLSPQEKIAYGLAQRERGR